MTTLLVRAAKEALIILAVGVVVGLGVNYARKDSIPLVADAEAFRIRTKAEFIKPDDARRLFERGNAFFIDARDQKVFDREHIEGALNLPPTGGDAEGLSWMAPADPTLIAYASQGIERQAGVVADKLLEAGFKKVYVLLNGIDAWKRMGLPVQRTEQ